MAASTMSAMTTRASAPLPVSGSVSPRAPSARRLNAHPADLSSPRSQIDDCDVVTRSRADSSPSPPILPALTGRPRTSQFPREPR